MLIPLKQSLQRKFSPCHNGCVRLASPGHHFFFSKRHCNILFPFPSKLALSVKLRQHEIGLLFYQIIAMSFLKNKLAPGRPCGAHSGEPLTRANRTITRPLVVTSCTSGQPQVTRSTSRTLGADPDEPLECRLSFSNVPGAGPGVDPGKLIERTHLSVDINFKNCPGVVFQIVKKNFSKELASC